MAIGRIPLLRIVTKKNLLGFAYTVVFLAFLVYGLIHRGLFFTPAKTAAMSGLAVLGFVGVLAVGVFYRLRAPRWLLLMYGYAAYALLSTLWSAAPNLAVDGAVMTVAVALFITFVPLLGAVWRKVLLALVALSGVGLYLFAMAVQFGILSFNQAIQSGMMDSVFQYHNTFGSYELAAALIAILLGIGEEKYVLRAAAFLVAVLNLYGVVASYSRWVWIALAIMAVAALLATRLAKRRLESFLFAAFAFLTAVLGAPFVIKSIHSVSWKSFILALIIAIALAAGIPYGLNKLEKVADHARKRAIAIGSLLVPVALGVLLLLLEKSSTAWLLQRLSTIQLQSSSLQGRFWYYGAAWRMWLSNPVFGSGYDTWMAKFQAFEQYNFWSTQTHSVFFSQLVNYGLIGTLLWLAVIGFAVCAAIRAVKTARENRMVYVAALFAALSLLMHALFDFDFDFPFVFAVFFVLLALATGEQKEEGVPVQGRRWLFAGLGAALGLAATVLGTGLSVAETDLKAVPLLTSPVSQMQTLQQALAFAPYDTDAQLGLAEIYYSEYQQIQSPQVRALVWNYAAQAERTGYWNPSVQKTVAVMAYQLKRYPQALAWARQASVDGPFTLQYPSAYMGISMWVGAHDYQRSPQFSRRLFQNVIATFQQLNARIAGLKNLPADVARTQAWTLQLDAPTQTYAATAEYSLGHYRQSLADARNLSDINQDPSTLGLYQMVTLLDEARLGHGSVAQIPAKLTAKNPELLKEFSVLASM